MKRLKAILLTVMLVMGITSTHAEDYKFFTIEKTDGTKQTMTAIGLTMNYENGYLVVHHDNTTTKILQTELKRMYFTNETAAIDNIESDKSSGNVTYDMQGRRIDRTQIMNRGVYIIKKDGKTQKVFVK